MMDIRRVVFAGFLPLSIFWGCRSVDQPELKTVNEVDLKSYMGLWYEIASYPNSFQKGCSCTTAEYNLLSSGKVEVLNRCIKKGKWTDAKGHAKAVDQSGNAKLKVSFFWPFYGDYYIIMLDQNYQWAVVGSPSREYLWILSRSPAMEPDQYQSIVQKLPDFGYTEELLVKTIQKCEDIKS